MIFAIPCLDMVFAIPCLGDIITFPCLGIAFPCFGGCCFCIVFANCLVNSFAILAVKFLVALFIVSEVLVVLI